MGARRTHDALQACSEMRPRWTFTSSPLHTTAALSPDCRPPWSVGCCSHGSRLLRGQACRFKRGESLAKPRASSSPHKALNKACIRQGAPLSFYRATNRARKMQTKTKLILYWTEIFSAPALGGGPWPHMATPISASALCDGTYGLSHGTQDDRELFVLRGQRGMEKGAHLGVHPSNGMHREEQVAQQRAPSTPPSHTW